MELIESEGLAEEDCLSAKRHMLNLIKIIKEGRSYFSEFMLYFYLLEMPIQRSFLKHIVAQVGGDEWEAMLADDFRWRDLLKSILITFSGPKDKGTSAPTTDHLIAHIVEYIKSPAPDAADSEIKSGSKKSFGELMEAIL